MKQDAKLKREEAIITAAYALLAEKGYGGMSMLAVAKRAKASNETLYRWYGDKIGLFRVLIQRNAELVSDQLLKSFDQEDAPRQVLTRLGPELLSMLLSPRAIALNRAAASDASDSLGQVLAQEGRAKVVPLIGRLFQSLVDQGDLRGEIPELVDFWLSLLIGDMQIRCATGAIAMPNQAQITARAENAEAKLFHMFGGAEV